MRIGILGGAFDPVHQGHIHLATSVEQYFDEIWLMPTYSHTHNKKMTAPEHRLEMCRLAVEAIAARSSVRNIKVSDFEIKNSLSGGTLSVAKELYKTYPDDDFYLIIGQDNADNIHTWRNHEQLLQQVKFFVVTRQGYPVCHDPYIWYQQLPHRYMHINSIEVSSTKIRAELLNTKACAKQIINLEKEVYDYIIDNELYESDA